MTGERRNWIQRAAGRNQTATAAVVLVAAVFLGSVAGVLAYREFGLPPVEEVVAKEKSGKEPGGMKKPGPGGTYAAQFSTASMYPAFDPDRRFYVTRCTPAKADVSVSAREGATVRVAGYPPTTGDFTAEARPLPGQDFKVEIEGTGTEVDGSYTLRCLPNGFPEWSYERFREPPRGVFVVAFRTVPMEFSQPWIVAFDQDGTPRWWHSPQLNALHAQILDDGTVQWARGFGDGFGQDSRGGMELMELDGTSITRLGTSGTPVDGHEFLKLENGNYMVMSYRPRTGVDLSGWGIEGPAGVLTGEIQEVTPDGEVVWSWNSWDHIGLDQVPEAWREIISKNPHTDPGGLDRYDYFHLNSIQPWGDQLVISTRHTDAVFGISKDSGEVLWKLGGTPTSRSLEIVGPDPNREEPLSGNHDARIYDGNLLTVYDNAAKFDRPPRLVRYRIDPEAGTATYVSEARDREAAPTSKCCGSARRFGSGWLTAWGDTPFVSGFDSRDRLAFRLELPEPSYRAVPVPAGVSVAEMGAALEAIEPDLPLGAPVRPIRVRGG